jgi:hypothetical protein
MRSMGPIEDLLREGGERVFVAWSEPEDPPRDRPIAHQDMPRMLWRLLGVSRLGPRIEIWRVNRR